MRGAGARADSRTRMSVSVSLADRRIGRGDPERRCDAARASAAATSGRPAGHATDAIAASSRSSVSSTTASVCAEDMNAASNADGAR